MNNSIQQLKADKRNLELDICGLLNRFEERHGENLIKFMNFRRYNGSNEAWGKIYEVIINLSL